LFFGCLARLFVGTVDVARIDLLVEQRDASAAGGWREIERVSIPVELAC
jgi:hypothetical protein